MVLNTRGLAPRLRIVVSAWAVQPIALSLRGAVLDKYRKYPDRAGQVVVAVQPRSGVLLDFGATDHLVIPKRAFADEHIYWAMAKAMRSAWEAAGSEIGEVVTALLRWDCGTWSWGRS